MPANQACYMTAWHAMIMACLSADSPNSLRHRLLSLTLMLTPPGRQSKILDCYAGLVTARALECSAGLR